jgi:hypothetical protein
VVFRRELYASVSLSVCLMFLGLRYLDVSPNISTIVCFAGGLAFRLAAIRFKWRLPVFRTSSAGSDRDSLWRCAPFPLLLRRRTQPSLRGGPCLAALT